MQTTKKKDTEVKKKENKLTELKADFEKEKAKPLFRKVRLIYKSCCGCGCDDVAIERTVPNDSALKDGDRIDIVIEGDAFIDD